MFAKSCHSSPSIVRFSFETLEDRTLLAGDVSFAEPVNYPAGGSPRTEVTADVNNDEIPDLIVGNRNFGDGGRVSVLLGNGDGTFARARSFTAGSSYIGGAADYDSDGYIDLGVTDPGRGLFFVLLNEGVSGNDWNGFSRPTARLRLDRAPQDVISGDLDNDGDMDVVVGSAGDVRVLLNKGLSNGQWEGFADPDDYAAGDHSSTVTAGDVDRDGDLDIVVGNYFSADVTVLLGKGDGTFDHLDNFPVGGRPCSVNLDDLDGDGDLDIATGVCATNDVAILMGMGDGTFDEQIHYPVSEPVKAVTTGDMDGDGALDVVVVPWEGRRIGLLINNGDGTFFEQENSFETARPGDPYYGTVADLDGDGDLDFVVPTAFGDGAGGTRIPGRGGVNVFLNTAFIPDPLGGDANRDGAFNQLDIVAVLQAGKYLTGEPATFAEGDWNGDGVFSQLDIVEALAVGDYLPGSNAAATIAKSVDEVLENESSLDDLLKW